MTETLPSATHELPPSLDECLPQFDKSWMIRLGALDAIAGSKRMINFLEAANQISPIGDDLEALARVIEAMA
jgi:hypothetical protein